MELLRCSNCRTFWSQLRESPSTCWSTPARGQLGSSPRHVLVRSHPSHRTHVWSTEGGAVGPCAHFCPKASLSYISLAPSLLPFLSVCLSIHLTVICLPRSCCPGSFKGGSALSFPSPALSLLSAHGSPLSELEEAGACLGVSDCLRDTIKASLSFRGAL